jgi:hypothetical protein
MTAVPPPAPPGWNRTMADLSAEMQRGERREIGWPESQWAIDYERSLLPAGTHFPREGEVYEVIEPLEVTVMISRAAPFTDSRRLVLAVGEQVVIASASDDRPITVYATAVDERAFKARLVPWWMRWWPVSQGFYLALDTLDLNTRFRRVREATN